MQIKAEDRDSLKWYADIQPFTEFSRITDPSVYVTVPGDSLLCITDVVASTEAVAKGQYKAVNMAGVAAISAVRNALGGVDFPFVFGGDGSSFLVAQNQHQRVQEALSATVQWAAAELQLGLRAAIIPISDVRDAGFDVRVARFAASTNVAYAMFADGGINWAERQTKSGRYQVPLAPPGAQPDLDGLSCRWSTVESRQGTILSLIVRKVPGADPTAFAAVTQDILQLIEHKGGGAGHPVSEHQLKFRWPPEGLDLEAKAARDSRSLLARKVRLWGYTLIAYASLRTGWKIGGFDPPRYRRDVAINSDYRKFDDGLRMTIDCHHGTADELERMLNQAQLAGIVRYGCHRQTGVLITCIVPSIHTNDHMHFVDGNAGGYTVAAAQIK